MRQRWTEAGRESGWDRPERYGEIGVQTLASYAWRFNSVVGWLCIMADGAALKTYVWWTDRQRIGRRLTRWPVAHRYSLLLRQVAEVHLGYQTSREVFDELLEGIEIASRHAPLKGSYVDLSCFRATGPYVDWLAALDNA
jgi:hypothetical protein